MNQQDVDFLSKYRFSVSGAGLLGAEVEYFLSKRQGPFQPVPDSPVFLRGVGSEWGYELSACQVEHHTSPTDSLQKLGRLLVQGRSQGIERARQIGRRLVAVEIAPEDMNLAIYDLDPRYVELAKKLPVEVLRAANRVAGTHLHIGMSSWEEALAVHNALAHHYREFLAMGDHSGGERIRLYKSMAPNFEPPQYLSLDHFCEVARTQNYLHDPRSCYHFVRINPKGTVEVRAFGIPRDPLETLRWMKAMLAVAELKEVA